MTKKGKVGVMSKAFQMPQDMGTGNGHKLQDDAGDGNEFDSLWEDEGEGVEGTLDPATETLPEEVVVEPVTESIPEPTHDCDYYEDRLAVAEDRWDTEKVFCETGLKVLALKDELEVTTAKLEEARKAVTKFDGESSEKPKTSPATKSKPTATTSPTAMPVVASGKTYEEAMAISLKSLDLGKIKRLGGQKLQRIYDAFGTVGGLEIARRQARDTRVHFSKVLPAGIGKGIADAIEEMLLDVLNRAAADENVATSCVAMSALSAAYGTSTESVADKPTEATASPADSDPPAATEDGLPPIVQRANEIDNGQPGCLDNQGSAGGRVWECGREAYRCKWDLSDCEYVPGKVQDDWIRGYLFEQITPAG